MGPELKYYTELNSDKKLKLSQIETLISRSAQSDKDVKERMAKNLKILEKFQDHLSAGRQHAVLIIFQGMDTAGKDGAIKHVMSEMNPQDCYVANFKSPTATELAHDFLWRVHMVTPARGQIGIFNRSHYEDVLIARVHPKLLRAEDVRDLKMKEQKVDEKFWRHRFQDIVNFESYLARQNCEIIKIFLHISKDEQKRRLLSRFDEANKQWKIEESDVRERAYWKEYQLAYEECLQHTATSENPWYIVPADDKPFARLSVSEILADRFSQLKLYYPPTDHKRKKELKKLKSLLLKE